MAHLPCIELDADEQARLLAIARESIRAGSRDVAVGKAPVEGNLALNSAVFVTLTEAGRLRGCVGSLEATLPLAQAVADAAFNAAYRDRRFEPLRAVEVDRVRIEVSVLSSMQAIDAPHRDALLDLLEPGVDGLLIEDRGRRATFLPQVWEKIPSAPEFLAQLMQKAGLPADHWSDSLRCRRYRSLSFAED